MLYLAGLIFISAGYPATASQPANSLNDSSAEPVIMGVAGLWNHHFPADTLLFRKYFFPVVCAKQCLFCFLVS